MFRVHGSGASDLVPGAEEASLGARSSSAASADLRVCNHLIRRKSVEMHVPPARKGHCADLTCSVESLTAPACGFSLHSSAGIQFRETLTLLFVSRTTRARN